jgi:Domain of unknown function (DUF4263)
MRPTYEIAQGPAAVPFSDYASITTKAWGALLSGTPTESAVQHFLEAHPALLPSSRGPVGASSEWPFINLLVTQPRLPGLDARQPDFLWFTTTSATWYLVLVEIEKPTRKIFRKDGVPTAHFTRARNQLNQWRTWFSEPANQIKFQHDYGVPELWTYRRTMALQLVLIYGRRHEFEHHPTLSKQRASLLSGDDEELMSFDRLALDPFLDDAVTVRALGNGRYRALRVPPTFTLGPNHADRFLYLDDLDRAIDSSDGWSEPRRLFVKQRIPYWVKWAKLEEQGWISGERE